ncbi:SpoIIE family protein phosphatase [Protofrankia sp. BMG5.30]|uniref:ATP-binding SpoIIE family protein phosphatase n=1 Tax=Protofrankia sp. BMG5.30 TaxID=1834514 RepID=UPI0020CA277C|nr:SpoIIE family protein phosphatase [Protofrankia sp. BMG5.30]
MTARYQLTSKGVRSPFVLVRQAVYERTGRLGCALSGRTFSGRFGGGGGGDAGAASDVGGNSGAGRAPAARGAAGAGSTVGGPVRPDEVQPDAGRATAGRTGAARTGTAAGRLGAVLAEIGRGTWSLGQMPLRQILGRPRERVPDRLELEHLGYLSDAGLVLSRSLDPQRIIDMIAALAVPRLGDGVIVFLRDGEKARLGTIVHRDSRAAGFLRDFLPSRLPTLDSEDGPGLVLRTGQTWYMPYLTDELLARMSPTGMTDIPFPDFLKGPTITVPMPGQGRVLGAVTLLRLSETYTPVDISLAEHLARRGAAALDNAQLYSVEQESALTLQRSLLPENPPALQGVEIAMEYRPGTAGTEAGGDLYDVIALPGGRVGIAIGDVMGRGLHAAAVMGQLRAALRAYALEDWPPAELLTRLDRVVDSLPGLHLTTCMYIVYDPAARRATVSNAGHLPPLLVMPDEEPDYLVLDPGLPLGVGGVGVFSETSLELPPGSGIVLYTDGLVESRRRPLEDGMDRLRRGLAKAMENATEGTGEGTADGAGEGAGEGMAAVDAGVPAAGASSSGSARALLHRCLAAAGVAVQTDDDTALLVMTTYPSRPALVDVALPAEPESAVRARSVVGRILTGRRLAAVADDALLLVSEVVTNAVLHARSDLVLRVHQEGDRLRVSVDDREGTRMPRRASGDDGESGWGLKIVDMLARGWGVETTGDGKRVWFDLAIPASGDTNGTPSP